MEIKITIGVERLRLKRKGINKGLSFYRQFCILKALQKNGEKNCCGKKIVLSLQRETKDNTIFYFKF